MNYSLQQMAGNGKPFVNIRVVESKQSMINKTSWIVGKIAHIIKSLILKVNHLSLGGGRIRGAIRAFDAGINIALA
jgi:hypothetical protein